MREKRISHSAQQCCLTHAHAPNTDMNFVINSMYIVIIMYPPGGILELTLDILVRSRFLVSTCLLHETHMLTGFHLSVHQSKNYLQWHI